MEKHAFTPQGVCSRKIEFEVENGKVYNVQFTGGCNGNLKAIGRLIDGKEIDDVVNVLLGNTCGFRNTSCADQLAKALKEAK